MPNDMVNRATINAVKSGDQRIDIELRNPKHFEEMLGRDVLIGFCRCFVHYDRLMSSVSCLYSSESCNGKESVTYQRDLDGQIWYIVGTLHELALAIQELREHLESQHILDHQCTAWLKISGFMARFEGENTYQRMRNSAAFHVDKKVLGKGIDRLLREQRVLLATGEGRKAGNSRLIIGFDALHNGLHPNVDELEIFLEKITTDLENASEGICELFINVAEQVGVPFISNSA